jgi:hypothetical protein
MKAGICGNEFRNDKTLKSFSESFPLLEGKDKQILVHFKSWLNFCGSALAELKLSCLNAFSIIKQ